MTTEHKLLTATRKLKPADSSDVAKVHPYVSTHISYKVKTIIEHILTIAESVQDCVTDVSKKIVDIRSKLAYNNHIGWNSEFEGKPEGYRALCYRC